MKLKLVIFLLIFSKTADSCTANISEIRELFYKAIYKESSAEEMLNKLEKTTPSSDPVLAGYKGIAFMLLAKYAFSPLNKYNYFIKGKFYIESAIQNDPKNIELRYLRLIVQNNVPSFLMYSGKLQEDKNAIVKGINGIEDLNFKNYMIHSLLQSNICTEDDKNKFR
jgi:hypothetical protein